MADPKPSSSNTEVSKTEAAKTEMSSNESTNAQSSKAGFSLNDKLRGASGAFPKGTTIVTTLHEGRDAGMTVSAFSSLSLNPPLVMLSVGNRSSSLPKLVEGNPVAISVLAQGQAPLAQQFARKGIDRFAGVKTQRTALDVPVISGCASWFTGTIESKTPAGDHTIVIVRVEDCDSDASVAPLLYQGGEFHCWPELGWRPSSI
ncbi:flavin reductase family protein [Corynebacterium sp.]|uniref:flavin reductase family protein n=1 Tax=Corynebacterium sp. TaxID=1720 RepID=UPI0027B985F7|nr:flavin reductase family protein [Corynebacterium sp.]